MNYLNESYNMDCIRDGTRSRLVYLSEYIFDFTTYDDAVSALFARKAVEVCEAINNKQTFEYQKKRKIDYKWYLIMVNMPFFANRLNWGASIRGAWWDFGPGKHFTLSNCSLELSDLKFDSKQWDLFIQSLVDFVKED